MMVVASADVVSVLQPHERACAGDSYVCRFVGMLDMTAKVRPLTARGSHACTW